MTTELKNSSPMSGGLSAPNCASDPEEKEISDDDDDDRNHKHRRRDTRSHSLEGDLSEQGLTQPYRKRNRPFENGQSGLHSEYNSNGGFSKFEKRRSIRPNFSRFSGEHSFGRGRGRDHQRDLRFGNIDTAMPLPLSHQGPIPSGMFSGRGLSNVSNVPTASWNSFGLIPTIPNGTIDTINPLAMPMLRSQLNPSFNMGIQRQRCPDFEERGFCLRGDMCPMEHGVNRIVVEDVQSLSQFNLPVSLPSAHLTGTSMGSGFLPSISVPSSAVINSSGAHGRASKSTVDDDALNMDGAFSGAGGNACTADVYDPDQPLWNNNSHNTSIHLFGSQPPKFDESETSLNAELSDHVAQGGGAAIAGQSTSSSVWGRLNNSSKCNLELKGKFDTRSKPSEYQESKSKEIREASGTQLTGKQNNLSTFGPNAKKSAQKAHRTLFVNCIPLKDNKKENLLSHFRKFGEVIDIYIPANTERAFVQFSKREEAERALKAPDAVMGSRFIKLWWANRDNIPDDTVSVPASSGPPLPAVARRREDNVQYAVSRVATSNAPDSLVNAGNESKAVIASGPKGPALQKKVGGLEHLKEELRKKQEMLEQKRIEFRRQLDKLAKQATGAKNEASDGQIMKKQKVETSTDALNSEKSLDAVVSGSSMQVEKLINQTSSLESFPSPRSKTNSAPLLLDPRNLKQALHPVMSGVPFQANRFKLDNRPTEFEICAPIPAGLATVAALKEHFKMYGDVSNVEIEELNEEDNPNACDSSEAARKWSAHVSFTTRHAAERAFSNAKSWQDHNLQFKWVTPNALRGVLNNSEVQSEEKIVQSDSQGIVDPTSTVIAHKPSNEPSSDDISTSSGGEKTPVAAEENLVCEGRSPNYIPLQSDDIEEDLKMEASETREEEEVA